MGILSLVRLIAKLVKGGDLIAFIVSAGVGYFLATFLPEGPWTNYVFILVTYHLFLTWLVIDSDHQKSLSASIPLAILTHVACLALILAIAFRHQNIPFYGVLRFSVAGFAFFERDWLFKGGVKKDESAEKKKPIKLAPTKVATPLVSADDAMSEATVEDHDAWLRYLSQSNRPYKRAGLSVKEEYEHWLIVRVSARHAAVQAEIASSLPPPDAPESRLRPVSPAPDC